MLSQTVVTQLTMSGYKKVMCSAQTVVLFPDPKFNTDININRSRQVECNKINSIPSLNSNVFFVWYIQECVGRDTLYGTDVKHNWTGLTCY